MSSPERSPLPRAFVPVTLAVLAILYAAYLVLPVHVAPNLFMFGGGGNQPPIFGIAAVLGVFFEPPLWPIAASHVLLWVGVGQFAFRRWRAAALLGALSLALGIGCLVFYSLFGDLEFMYGVAFKLACAASLAAAATYAAWRGAK